MLNVLGSLEKLKFCKIAAISMAGLAVLFQLGCVRISGSLSKIAGVNDFSKSQMLVLNTAIANGADLVYVNIRLVNSDGSVVNGFTPTIGVQAGGEILAPQCFASDANGVAICPLRSMTAGRRTIRVQNIPKITVAKQIEFKSIPLRRDQIAAVTGASQTFTAGPYKVKASVSSNAGPLQQTSGKYTVFSSVQGSFTAQSGTK